MPAGIRRSLLRLAAALGLVPLAGREAAALPVFAAQTGQPCSTCHVGSFGPQLTPLGRAFKLGGYTMNNGTGPGSRIPLAAMLLSSLNDTKARQPAPPAPGLGGNDNFVLDQISVFLAGRATDYAGGFVQATYDGVTHATRLDNTDLRLTKPFSVLGQQLQVGLDVNNNPTVQDPFNTTPAWGFPFAQSAVVPLPAAQPLLSGAFAGNVVGLTAYAWLNQSIYAEAGGYKSLRPRWLGALGETAAPGLIESVAPYVRLAYETQWNGQDAEIGLLGLYAPLSENHFGSPGSNIYYDYGFDASYQFLGSGKHVFSAYGLFVREAQSLNAALAAGSAARSRHDLNQLRLNASYYFDRSYGLTLGWVDTFGTRDALLYAPAPLTGSRTGRPDSKAFVAQADWTPFGKSDSWGAPWANLRLGLQYTAYLQFNGAASNYDGFGRNANGNDTIYAFAWLAF